MAEEITSKTNIKFGGNTLGGSKVLQLETLATADNGDTILITLANYGATGIQWIDAYRHTTTNQVIVADDAPSTSVTNGVLTITIGGSTANKKRTILIGLS